MYPSDLIQTDEIYWLSGCVGGSMPLTSFNVKMTTRVGSSFKRLFRVNVSPIGNQPLERDRNEQLVD